MPKNWTEALQDSVIRLQVQLTELEHSLTKTREKLLHELVTELVLLAGVTSDPTVLPNLISQRAFIRLSTIADQSLTDVRDTCGEAAKVQQLLLRVVQRLQSGEVMVGEQTNSDESPFDLEEILDPFGEGIEFWSELWGMSEEDTRSLFNLMLLFGLSYEEAWRRWAETQARRIQSRVAMTLSEEMVDAFSSSGESGVEGRIGLRTQSRLHGDISSILVTGRSSAGVTAAGLASTQIIHHANEITKRTVRAFPDLFHGLQWVAVLDSRVCVRCGSLNGQLYGVNADLPPIPLHPLCRCLLSPVMAGYPPPETTDFSGWLRRQSKSYRQSILGVSGAELFDSGRATIRDFVDFRSRATPRSRTLNEIIGRLST